MDSSILISIKKNIGLTAEDEYFDDDIVLYINSVFSTLYQLGAGPKNGFRIESDIEEWGNYTDKPILLGFVKDYIYIKTKLKFDPPTSSVVHASMERQAVELEGRIRDQIEIFEILESNNKEDSNE